MKSLLPVFVVTLRFVVHKYMANIYYCRQKLFHNRNLWESLLSKSLSFGICNRTNLLTVNS